MTGSVRRRRLATLGSAVAVSAVLLLTACTSNPVQASPEPGPSSSAGGDAVDGQTGADAPAATPTSGVPTGIPVTFTCDQIVTTDQLAKFDPALTPDSGYSPAAGSAAATVVELQGIACAWSKSGADRVEVSVAQLSPDDIEARKNLMVSESKQVPTFKAVADEGYFRVDGSIGRADAFVGDYWVVADSSLFYEPGDAQLVVEDVATALTR